MLLTGVGPFHAARALADRLAGGRLPDLVVSSGFAGALSTELALSSWITGARVSEWNEAESVAIEVQGLDLVCAPGLAQCDVVSSSVLALPGAPMSGSSTPLAIDMESAALAREARRRGVRFAVARLISDTPAQPLPAFMAPFAAALAAPGTEARLRAAGRGLRAAAGDPRGVVRFVGQSSTWLRALEGGWSRLDLDAWGAVLR